LKLRLSTKLKLLRVLDRFESFREGHENLDNSPSSGQLSNDRNPTIVSKFHELVDTDHQITLKLGGGRNLHINWEKICQRTRKNLRNSQVSIKFVRQRCHNLWKRPLGVVEIRHTITSTPISRLSSIPFRDNHPQTKMMSRTPGRQKERNLPVKLSSLGYFACVFMQLAEELKTRFAVASTEQTSAHHVTSTSSTASEHNAMTK
jgi:hypothetical protein